MKFAIVIEDIEPSDDNPSNLTVNFFPVTNSNERSGGITQAALLIEYLEMAVNHFFDVAAQKAEPDTDHVIH